VGKLNVGYNPLVSSFRWGKEFGSI